jgi:hypothetical protein
MTKGIDRYEAERAEALARLILTRRRGVSFYTLGDRDSRLDFIVSMKEAKDELIAAFGGIMVSTPDLLPDEEDAQRYTKGWKEPKHLRTYFPLLLFLFSTADDQGYFSWILRPHEGRLEWVSSLEMSKITKKSLDSIFETAENWNRTLTEAFAKVPVK